LDVATDQLDTLIERRADKTPDPDELEPSYAESVRRYHAKRQQQARWEWIRYYGRLARCHARLAEENEARAEALMEGDRG
jgi:hypothetical protein